MTDNLHRIFIDDKKTKDGRKPAVKIGKYLCVALTNQKMVHLDPSYMIYVISTNNPICDIRFTYEDAVRFAKSIEDVYKEYLEIYEVYPDWDVLNIARLSVPNGEELYERIMSLNVSTEDDL